MALSRESSRAASQACATLPLSSPTVTAARSHRALRDGHASGRTAGARAASTRSSIAARRCAARRAARTWTATQNAVAAMPSGDRPEGGAERDLTFGGVSFRVAQTLEQRQRTEEQPRARRDARAHARHPREARQSPLELEELLVDERVALPLVALVECGQEVALPRRCARPRPATAVERSTERRRRGRPRGPRGACAARAPSARRPTPVGDRWRARRPARRWPRPASRSTA